MAAADVWIVSMPDDDADVPLARSLLTRGERARAARFRHDSDRRSYVYGHAAVRVLLGRAGGSPPEHRPFAAGPHGKPLIAGAPEFNLSRAGSRAAVGVSAGTEIGVDIERIEHESGDVDQGASRFSAAERAWLDRAPTADARVHRYLRLWVIREALLKAQGVGLAGELADGDLAIEADAPCVRPDSEWHVIEAPESAGTCLRGYVAAAAVRRGCGVTWHCTRWSEIAVGMS